MISISVGRHGHVVVVKRDKRDGTQPGGGKEGKDEERTCLADDEEQERDEDDGARVASLDAPGGGRCVCSRRTSDTCSIE